MSKKSILPVHLILTNLREQHAEKGLDWIIVSANALAVAVVILASANSNPFDFAEATTPAPTFAVASLD